MAMQTNWVARCAFGITATIIMAQSPTSPADAQQRVTETEIEQRMKLKQLTVKAAPSREQVIDELIEEKFKIEHARRRGEEVSDQAVDQAYAEIARRMGQTAEQLTEDLARKGVDVETLKHRIRAALAWQRSRYLRRNLFEQPKLWGPTGDFWWLDDRERYFHR